MKILTAILLVCLFAFPAVAFVPDDGELSAQVRKTYGPLTSWEAEMTFPAYPGVAVHLWYARGKWRQEWRAGTAAVAVGKNGNVVAECTPDGFPLSPLFVWMTPDPVEAWKSWGVDNTVRNFGFYDDQPCCLLGAEPGEETRPTVRLNNEDMAPLLVRYGSSDGLISVRYGDYRTLGGFRVPRTVVTTFADGRVLEAGVKWIAVNRADGEDLYDRDSVGSTPCVVPPAPFDLLRDAFRYPQPR